MDQVTDLPALKPIYFRLDQISKQFPNDFDVQVVASDLKQRLVSHGQKLKDAQIGSTAVLPSSQTPAMAAPPASMGSVSSQMPGGPMPPPPTSSVPTAAIATPPSMQTPSARMPSGNQPKAYQTSASQPPPKKTGGSPNYKRALLIGAGLGLVVAIGVIGVLVQVARNRNIDNKDKKGASGTVFPVEIVTVPPGATVQVGNQERQEKCTSNCKVELPPGNYQVTAFLDGFDPAMTGVTVTEGSASSVSLPLTAQAQALRILSDIGGKVTMDGKPAGDILEGQFTLDRVPAGQHQVTISGPNGDAAFSFTSVAGKAPTLDGPATGRNVLAVLVAGAANRAKIHSSAGPLKLQFDGQPRGDVSASGVEITDLRAGEHEVLVGEGKDAKKMILSFGQTPTLTAYLKSDVNAGFLVVVAGQEDDVAITLEGRPFARKTVRGQLRVQLPPGKYRVKPAKDGFEPVAEQTAEIKKGEEAKLAFTMKPLPRVATLKVTGATPNATVLVDKQPVGKVGPDGAFTSTITSLGEKVIEFQLAGYSSRTYNKAFRAGETVAVTDAVLAQAISTIRLVLNTPLGETRLSIKRDSDAQPRSITDPVINGLPPGTYTITARANGYNERSVTVNLPGGETRNVDIALTKTAVVVQQQTPVGGGIGDLEGNFIREGNAYVLKGSAVAPYKSAQTNGTFTFTVKPIRGKRVRWMVGAKDSKNYAYFEMEKNKLTRRDVQNGNNKKLDESKFNQQDEFQVQVDVRNGSVVHKVSIGGNWTVVDNWVDASRNFGDGRFAFVVEGRDEIAISDFKFVPSR